MLIQVFFLANSHSAPPGYSNHEVVTFDSAPYTYEPTPFAIKQANKLGKEPAGKEEPVVPLVGYLEKPDGDGPHPAVVLLHACIGITVHDAWWSANLAAWGYVVLTVDSFAPRGVEYLCDGRSLTPAPWHRALDAYGAREYLAGLPFVDETSISVMGLSHGGMTILELIKEKPFASSGLEPFNAAVALYPLCGAPEPVRNPTLILIGSEDNWTPAIQCEEYAAGVEGPISVDLVVYAGAHHLFDYPDIDTEELGKTLRTHPEASQLSQQAARDFLAQHN